MNQFVGKQQEDSSNQNSPASANLGEVWNGRKHKTKTKQNQPQASASNFLKIEGGGGGMGSRQFRRLAGLETTSPLLTQPALGVNSHLPPSKSSGRKSVVLGLQQRADRSGIAWVNVTPARIQTKAI